MIVTVFFDSCWVKWILRALISFWCWINAIISNCSFTWLVLLLFDDWLFYYFLLYHLPKSVEPMSVQNATICSLFESLNSNIENSIRWFFFMWIKNVNAAVATNLIHFNSVLYNFDLWIRPKIFSGNQYYFVS